jgi:ankyrin repeat protein
MNEMEEEFCYLCENGNLEDAQQFLLENPTLNVLTDNDFTFNAFASASYEGHLHIMHWLLKICPEIITSGREYIFIMSCYRGHLIIPKWLLKVCPTINISIDNESAFRHACYNGHLLVAQWLLNVKPDINISVNNNEVFICAAKNKNLNIMKWLASLKPHLYIINYWKNGGYKSYDINSKEEERWSQRKQLVWLASNDSPCKSNIFYRIPEDVSRYIISNYL